jgi:23S rRNA pseudouridine2605 synthase
VRLQKYMAACGVAARRRCEEMIAAGRVCVNDAVVTEMGVKVDPHTDKVTLDGARVSPPAAGLVYFMFHKPRGYLTAAADQRGRPTIFALLGHISERVVPVGRLDMDSEGLLLLTNDGAAAHKLMHPRFRVEKEYEVEVRGALGEAERGQLEEGVEIDGSLTRPARVRVLGGGDAPDSTRARIVITEGRKRQVRRMFDAVGHPVLRLIRVREGCLHLGDLPPGKTRPLSEAEVRELRRELEME